MNFLRKFMYGRYGADQLSLALLIFSAILTVIMQIICICTGIYWLTFIDWLPLVWSLFRMLSRNIQKRRIENEKFLKFWNPIKSKILFQKEKFANRKKFRYLKCPNCKANLRVPRLGGKKISVSCNKCKTEFTTKA